MKKLFLWGIPGIAVGVLLYILVISKEPAKNPEEQPSGEPVKTASILSENDLAISKPSSSGDSYMDRFLTEFREAVEEEDNAKIESMMKEFAKRDLEAAAKFAASLPPGSPRAVAMRSVARVWAELSPEKALAWAATLGKENDERRRTEQFICFQIAEKDPVAAMKWAGTAGYGNDSGLMGSFVTQWSMHDMGSALEWTLNQPQNEARDNLLHGVLVEMSKTDPVRAAQLISSEMSAGGTFQEETALQILPSWKTQDPAAAAKWVEQFPPGEIGRASCRERVLELV